MLIHDSSETLSRVGLIAAVGVPIIYFGSQVVAAPFYPDYSFLANSASQLGSDRSDLPAVLNTGAILTGLLALLGAYGLTRTLPTIGVRRVWASLVGLSLVSTGLAAIWAGTFHLPDPRHNPGALGAGTFAGPLLLLLAVWPLPQARTLKVYLAGNLLAFAALAPILGGATALDLQSYGGLFQRLAACVFYLPIGVVGHFAIGRVSRMRSARESPHPAT